MDSYDWTVKRVKYGQLQTVRMMLNGCHDCWSYKAIKYAFDAKLTNFDPDNNILSTQTFNEVCSISFNEDYIIEYINTLYNNNNNNRRLVTLAEHTSDHGRQTNSSTEEKGEQV